jgi:hypothetical protein
MIEAQFAFSQKGSWAAPPGDYSGSGMGFFEHQSTARVTTHTFRPKSGKGRTGEP